jgi:hypothetical protein
MKKFLIGVAALALVSSGAFAQVNLQGKGSATGGAGLGASAPGANVQGRGSAGASGNVGAGSGGATTGSGINADTRAGAGAGGVDVNSRGSAGANGGLGAKVR